MSNLSDERHPIVDSLLMALKSRRVLIASVTLLVGIITLAIPELEVVRDELLTLLITVSLVMIGGYSIKDAAFAARENRLNSANTEVESAYEATLNKQDEEQEQAHQETDHV